MAPDEFVEQPDACLAPFYLQRGIRKVRSKVGCPGICRVGWWRIWNCREEGQDALVNVDFDSTGRHTVNAEVELDAT